MAAVCYNSTAQILYSNTFDNGLNGMKIVDSDGNAPHPNVSEFGGSWTALPSTRFEQYNSAAAVSTSFYSPSNTSDDWLITPAINIPVGALLTWDGFSIDDDFRDSYEIRVSTTGDDPADFTNLLFKVDAEEPELTTRSVVLDDYAGQSVYIAFRNTSSDKFLLVLDNIFVRLPFERDVFVKSLDMGLNFVESQNTFVTHAEGKRLRARLLNFGSKRITEFDVSYSINGREFQETVTGNLDSGEDMIFESNIIDVPVGNGQVISIDIESINSLSDEVASNNQVSIGYDGMPDTPGYNGKDSKGGDINTITFGRDAKSIVYYFFRSDCDDCEDAIDDLNQFYLSQGAGSEDLEVIGVTLNPDDDNATLNSLGWGALFPMVQYITYNDRLYTHYAKNLGLSPNGELPFAVQVCPNTDNPSFSTVVSSDEGFDNDNVFNTVFRDDHDDCQRLVSSVEDIDAVNSISLFPNPTQAQMVSLNINTVESTSVSISVMDIMGQKLRDYGVKDLVIGENSINLDISDLAAGAYSVRLLKDNQLNSVKLIITK